MGIIYKIKCKECQNEWRLFLGYGLKHTSLSDVSTYFSDKDNSEIVSLINENEYKYCNFNYRCGLCRECNEFTSVPVITLVKKVNGSKEYKYIAHNICRNNHKILMSDIIFSDNLSEAFMSFKEISCPQCNQNSFDIVEEGFWD